MSRRVGGWRSSNSEAFQSGSHLGLSSVGRVESEIEGVWRGRLCSCVAVYVL